MQVNITQNNEFSDTKNIEHYFADLKIRYRKMMLTNSLLGRSGLIDLVPLLVGELQNTLDRLQMTL